MHLEKLSLNNWPPLASHLSVLILGILLANIGTSSVPSKPQLRPGVAMLRLGYEQLRVLSKDKETKKSNEVVLVAINDRDEIVCRMSKTSMMLVGFDQGPTVVMPLAHVDEFVRIVTGDRRLFVGMALLSATEATNLALCARGGGVTYGAPNL